MQTFKNVLFFLFTLLVCEGIAVGASAWSFLESASASFEQLKISSDHRARDTISSLSKSTEAKLDLEKLADLDFTFARLVKVTLGDKDGFWIKEISLVDDRGVVLASSEETFLEDPVRKRKPESKFLSPTYTVSHRLRKWQVGTPVLLGSRKDLSVYEQPLLKYLVSYFPEIGEPDVLLSMGVYHPEKLERVASLFLTYERGNFTRFVSHQSDLFFWITQNNAWIALICALFISFIHLLIKSAGPSVSVRSEQARPAASSAPSSVRTGGSPPLWEKVDFASTDGPVRWQGGAPTSEAAPIASAPPKSVEPAPVRNTMPANPVQTVVPEQKVSVPQNPVVVSSQRSERPEILDAIYLG
ncbi:hypothetical protein EHO61_13085 [Leptospira fluminis]|uniref:Uncharacterized protein n=1 Tax=Leptospira fluminis TaxID=2484979 RepID=A0A4R9GM91_9LEPT|nr:hypothetical protein [Leptospira fluminis]TGK17332.1 hypothetical protein EHO61_13085 [Leptospira fluminis]